LNWRFSKPSNQVLGSSLETAAEMSVEVVLISVDFDVYRRSWQLAS
jgi:hypothetical protein